MSVLSAIPPKFKKDQINQIMFDNFGFNGLISELDSERDQNFKLQCDNGDKYIIKISNPKEDIEFIKLQTSAQLHILNYNQNLKVPVPKITKSGKEFARFNGYLIRVQSFLEGNFIKDINNPSNQLLNNFGEFLGLFDTALQSFNYPTLEREWVWDIKNINFLKRHLIHLINENEQKIIHHFIQKYENYVLPKDKFLRIQYIHNDGNDHNVIVNENNEISGIIDFGDMAHSYLVCELAVAITYLILEDESPSEKINTILSGYQNILPLRDEEISSLIYLICIRACHTVVTANYRKKIFPENKYISVTEPKAWEFLKNMVDKNLNQFNF